MAKTPQHAPEGARRDDAPPPPAPPSPRSLKDPPRPIMPDPVDQKADVQDLQKWHIGVALFHLKEVNPDVMQNELLDAWGKLTNHVVLMTDALDKLEGW